LLLQTFDAASIGVGGGYDSGGDDDSNNTSDASSARLLALLQQLSDLMLGWDGAAEDLCSWRCTERPVQIHPHFGHQNYDSHDTFGGGGGGGGSGGGGGDAGGRGGGDDEDEAGGVALSIVVRHGVLDVLARVLRHASDERDGGGGGSGGGSGALLMGGGGGGGIDDHVLECVRWIMVRLRRRPGE
jgi:hypothetical protein